MPYFVYKIFEESGNKTLEYVEEHDAFLDARNCVRTMRAQMPIDADYTVRIMFAGNQGEAKMHLTEKREAPVLKEWEK